VVVRFSWVVLHVPFKQSYLANYLSITTNKSMFNISNIIT
jgi:hypothetical protein